MGRRASVLIVVGLLLGSLTAGRVWVQFTLTDPVLGPQATTATGYDASPALSAVSIVALAAGLVVLLTRQTPRMLASVVLAADAGWAGWLALSVLMDPGGSVGRQDVARVGTPSAQGLPVSADSGTVWPWLFLAAAAAVVAGCLIVVIDVPRSRARVRTAGLDPAAAEASTETAAAPSSLPPAEVERRANARAWNELSQGKDPTTES